MILKHDGSFWATGANNEGQLGDGSMIDKTIFVKVAQTERPRGGGLPYDGT